MNTSKPFSKLMAMILSVALVFTMMPFTVSAEAAGCTHEHDEACGYVEGAPCGHTHDEACGWDEGTETGCAHAHDGDCGYIEAAPCGHVHDASCGGLSSGDSGNPTSAPADAVTVAAFDELDEYTLWQGYDYGEIEAEDGLDLPDTLTGTDADGGSVTIKGVTWESEPEFDPEVSVMWPGYVFSPKLPEGYVPAEGVESPMISVFIRPEGGATPAPMTVGDTFFDQGSDLYFHVLTEASGSGTVMVAGNSYTGTSYSIPENVTKGGIIYTVTEIGIGAFSGCAGLTSVTIGDNVAKIGHGAFSDCTGLTSIAIPDSVAIIYQQAFGGCTNLSTITLGNSLTTIDHQAFQGCTSLTGVIIPDSVTNIGDRAFFGCTSLTVITFLGDTPPAIGVDVFGSISNPVIVNVPQGAEGTYASLLSLLPPGSSIVEPQTPGGVCAIGGTTYTTLDRAFDAAKGGDTIKALQNIDYNSYIGVDGDDLGGNKTITVDTNGFTVNINDADSGIALDVWNGAVVELRGAGALNVSSQNGIGLWVNDEGSKATVTNVTAINAGLENYNGGVTAGTGGAVTVKGNVTAHGNGSIGAYAFDGGTVTIDGKLTGNTYIAFVDFEDDIITKTQADYEAQTTKAGYYTYTHTDCQNRISTVWVKIPGGGGGGGSSSSDSSSSSSSWSIAVGSTPDMPTWATVTLTGKPDANGLLTETITDQMVRNAIEKAEAEVKRLGRQSFGISIGFTNKNSGVTSLTVKLDEAAISRLKSSGAEFCAVNTGVFLFSIDKSAIAELSSQTKGVVTFTATPVTKLSDAASAAIGSRPVFDFTVTDSTGKTITSYGKGTVTRGIKYTAVTTEKTGSLFIVKIVDGKAQWINNSSYDSGWMIWSGDSNSVYGVAYKTPVPAYTDTADHWAKDDIDFAASRGLISGTSATEFSPNTAIIRADFLMALGKFSGVDVSGYTASSFTDVTNTNPAMPYIEWAVKNGIVQGIGNNQFGSDRLISREQMAVMMVNYAKATNYKLPVSRQAVTFADDAKISSWAKDAVKAIQQTGIIVGKNNNLFDPQGSATRAEASVILRRFVELVIDEGTARGWVQNDAGQWQYINTNGKAVTGWLTVGDNKYWFDDKAVMVSGKWVQISGKWYNFYTDGKLAVSTTIDGYTVGADGAWKE